MFFVAKPTRFIQRIPILDTYDYEVEDFTLDGGTYLLDISSIVPANARRVKVWVEWFTTEMGNVFRIFSSNCPKHPGSGAVRTQVTGGKIIDIFDIVLTDVIKINYQSSIYGGEVTSLSMNIIGWWI